MIGIEKALLSFRGAFVLDTAGKASVAAPYQAQEGIEKLPRILDIATPLGQDTYLLLTEDGEVFGFGGNDEYLLGDPTFGFKASGLVENLTRIHPELPTNLVAIDATNTMALGLDTNGSLWAWGEDRWNEFSPLYTPSQDGSVVRLDIANVRQMQLGTSHLSLLRTDGSVLCFRKGKLVGIEGLPPIKEMALGVDCTLGLSMDGDVFIWGPGHGVLGEAAEFDSLPQRMTGMAEILGIACGYDYALAVENDGSVAGWGNLQDGDTRVTAATDRGLVPVSMEASAFPRLWKSHEDLGPQTQVGMLPQLWVVQDVFRQLNSKGLHL